MMRVLVVGSGGREHALVWKIRQSELVSEIFVAPGNAGSRMLATPVDLDPTNIVELADFAQEVKIDLTVVGPELPLSLGIVDEFRERGLACFGPNKKAARIESSKVFTKEFLQRHSIPTAAFRVADTIEEAESAVASGEFGYPVVLKADGLAAGKGVVICGSREEAVQTARNMMVERQFGNAGDRVLIEECLEGVELSFLAFADGTDLMPMASSQDYKRALDDDQGPNTGGMGAISPSPYLTLETSARILNEVMVPTIRGMAEEGRPYKGILYAGLMLTGDGPKVLEYNCRFGDPEIQAILPRMASDIVPLFYASIEGDLAKQPAMEWHQAACACVVAASGGYPGSYEKGKKIEGLKQAGAMDKVVIFHAGTAAGGEGDIVTAGGRVLGVTALAPSLRGALDKAYEAVDAISFEGMHCRRDIGRTALAHLESLGEKGGIDG